MAGPLFTKLQQSSVAHLTNVYHILGRYGAGQTKDNVLLGVIRTAKLEEVVPQVVFQGEKGVQFVHRRPVDLDGYELRALTQVHL